MRLERDLWGKARTKGQVIIDFTVDGERDLAIIAHEGLGTRICARVRSPRVLIG